MKEVNMEVIDRNCFEMNSEEGFPTDQSLPMNFGESTLEHRTKVHSLSPKIKEMKEIKKDHKSM